MSTLFPSRQQFLGPNLQNLASHAFRLQHQSHRTLQVHECTAKSAFYSISESNETFKTGRIRTQVDDHLDEAHYRPLQRRKMNVYVTNLGTNLVTALSGLDMYDFTHFDIRKGDIKSTQCQQSMYQCTAAAATAISRLPPPRV